MEADFFIVGQGLAGSLLSYELIKKNKRVIVFDDPTYPKASSVAAGIVNPVVFRRMTKSWMADDAFPAMENTYSDLEQLLNEKFYYPTQILKLLSEEMAIQWKDKSFANRLEEYLMPEIFENNILEPQLCYSKIGIISKAGRLDLQKFIEAFAQYLFKNKMLISEKFDFNSICFSDESVHYKNQQAKKVIFCEGPAASDNPFFKKIKFKHSKGEVLDLEIPALKTSRIINGDVFVAPVLEHQFKVGATFCWNELDFEPSQLARDEITSKFKSFMPYEFRVLSHKAGVRPTAHDRKPVMGVLPDNLQIGIFNGLGSKGVLLGPYFAHQLAEFLTGKSTFINPEVDVRRYYKC
jgi:FAD dependent oxidoreductase.